MVRRVSGARLNIGRPDGRTDPDAAARYRRVRDATVALVAPLSAEDCCAQSMADASPAKWHLAHTTWFFETFVLEQFEPDFRAFHAAFRVLFNSYYDSVGDKHPRPQRGLLTRPDLATVLDWRRDVDARMARLIARGGALPASFHEFVVLGLEHEQQHQELLLTDIKHLFSLNPLQPAYAANAAARGAAPAVAAHGADAAQALRAGAAGNGRRAAPAPPLAWQAVPAGTTQIGYSGNGGFCFDNELPRHTVYLQACELASRLVTNGQYAEFIAAGGYGEPRHWLAEARDWLAAAAHHYPYYWRPTSHGWAEFTLGGLRALDPAEPVVHVSYYEADAYARWAGARLPREQEWERLAAGVAAGVVNGGASDGASDVASNVVSGNFVDSGHLHPVAADAPGLVQMFGDVWEWTQSSYAPYPGFRPAAGAVGEYNGKFMVNQYVLRGGSCVSPPDHLRTSYRNFLPAGACWQFSGIRLARD